MSFGIKSKKSAKNKAQNVVIRAGAVLLLSIYLLLSTVASSLDKFSKSPRDMDVVNERRDLRVKVLSQIKNHVKHFLNSSEPTKKPRHRA